MSKEIEDRHRMISAALELLAELFTPDCQVAFVMCKPDNPECWMLVGDVDPSELSEVARRAAESEAAG